MGYLLKHSNTFICVDSTPKQGLFCQFYNEFGFSRPIQIHPNPLSNYCANVDHKGNPHILYLNDKNQISYFCFENHHYTKKVILDGSKGIYHFSNLSLHYLNEKLYFFYASNKPNTSSCVLLQQILNQQQEPVPVLETNSNAQGFKFFTINNRIYLFYIVHSHVYTLKCIRLDKMSASVDIFTSDFPIHHYSVCGDTDSENFYVVYTKACYGQYQIICYSMHSNTHTVLCNLSVSANPAIFNYHNSLWVTYMDNQKLHAALSVDHGLTFSMPILCTHQDNIGLYNFFTTGNYNLSASSLYASVSNSIRLPVLAAMDIKNIHPNAKSNIELELFFEGFYLMSSHYKNIIPASEELSELQKSYEELQKKYEEAKKQLSANNAASQTQSVAAKTNDLKSAASAFMNEIHGFDAMPNI